MKILKTIFMLAVAAIIACGGSVKKSEPALDNSDQQELDEYSAYRAYDHFVKGELYEQSGNLELAVEEYRKALIYDPGSSDIKRHLSDVYFQQRKLDEAAVLRSEITDKTVEDYNFIGICLQHTDDFNGAVEFYERSLEIDSTQYAPRKNMANLKRILGDEKEAEKHFRIAIDYAPDKVLAYLDLGGFFFDLKRYDDALAIYKEASEIDPDDIRATSQIAAVFMIQNDTTGADSIYTAIAKKHWDNLKMLQSLSSIFYNLGNQQMTLDIAGRIAELMPEEPHALKHYGLILYSVEKYSEAESIFVELIDNGFEDSDVYYYLGRISRFERRFVDGENYFSKAIAINDTLIDAYVNQAICVDAQTRYDDALTIMNDALIKLPADSTTIIFYTALIHNNNKNFELSGQGYKRLLTSNPDNNQFRFNLAAAYERMGNFDDAEIEFLKILETDSENALTLNYLGYMYADMGIKLEKSEELIVKALEIDPDNGAFLDSYAWVLYKLKRYDEAIVQLNKALEYEDSDSILFDHQGDIYTALNEPEKAKKSWEKALQLDPDNEEILRKLNLK
jgi:tetratricopeptide (TPR) repeat protein